MNTGIVDRLLDTYIAVGDGAIQAIRPDVMYILVTLAMIGLTWAHLRNAITARESPLNLLIVQFMMVGFFVWLLNNWASLMKVFMEGMIKLGLKAGGFAMSPEQFLHPSEIAAAGVRIVTPLIDAIGLSGWFYGTNIILGVAMFVVIAAFFIMSLQVLMVIVEFKLGVVWCFFMVALGVFKGTAFASEKALGYVFATGIKLFGLATVVSVGSLLMLTFGTFADPKAPTYGEAFGVALGALFLGGLAWFIPAKVAGVISGGPALSAGAAVGTMAAMAATAAVGGMGVAAAAKAASGTNALRAASTGGGAIRGGLGLPAAGAPGEAGVSPAGGVAGRGGLSPQMKANPALSSHALETMDRTERAHAAAKSNGVKPTDAEHARAQEYRGLAWDIGDSMQESNPKLAGKIDNELGRIEAMKLELAEAGVSSASNSAHLAEEYRNVATRALNLDGGGGFDIPTLSTSLTPEGQAQNASLASSLGVGDDIRTMAAKGMTTRQIAEGLGDRLSAVNKQAERIGQGSDAPLHRMSVVQAYKDEHGIPNPSAAGFKAWAAGEKAQTAAASSGTQSSQPGRSQPPSWAKNFSLSKIPANLNAMVPRGAEKSAGINASNTGASE